MTVINQHEVVGKDEDDESGKKLPRFCCLVLTLSRLAYLVYQGAKPQACSDCQGPLAASQGSGVTFGSPSRGASSSFWTVARSPSAPMAASWLVLHAEWSLMHFIPCDKLRQLLF